MSDIKFISFDSLSGTLVASNGAGEFAIEVPVEDGKFITGNALMAYVKGLIPASAPRDTSTVVGAEDITALCIRQPEVYEPTYHELRSQEYPPITDYIDGLVKGDEAQVQMYLERCRAVKEKYPKPVPVEVSPEVLRQRRGL